MECLVSSVRSGLIFVAYFIITHSGLLDYYTANLYVRVHL